jgi:ribosome biogenesis GTPase
MRTDTGIATGTVVENHGALFDVLVERRVVKCLLRGKLKKDRRREVAPVAAGDVVTVRMLEHGRGVIEHVLPRHSGLSRRAAGAEPLQHTLVANVEQAIIVFAAAEPRPDLFKLDRFLVAAAAGRLESVLVINKVDMVDGDLVRSRRGAAGAPAASRARAAEGASPLLQFAVYRQCGFRVLLTSALRGDGLSDLKEILKDRRSVICGPSGVGKSSLLNAIAPGLRLRTAEVGEVTHKGRHTTSSISLLELPFGGWIADTPGLRQLNFHEITREQIAKAFPDLEAYLDRCKYSNCSHRDEQGCALREAAAAGGVDGRRLRSFLEMGGR